MKHFKPDSVGITCPYMENVLNAYFRVEAEIDENIDVEILKQAVEDLKPRFPTFFVKIIKSHQLYIFEKAPELNAVFKEDIRLFQAFDFENQLPFRIMIHNNRVSIEFFHMITDAHGGMIFIKSLIAQYYVLKGEPMSYNAEVLNPLDSPTKEETEDPFMTIYSKTKTAATFPAKLSSLSYQYLPKDHQTSLWVTLLKTSSEQLYDLAKSYNTSVGAFLCALYLYSFYLYDGKSSHRDIRLSVPIDLRTRLNIHTLRNFCLYATAEINPLQEDWTFEKILALIDSQIKCQLDKNSLIAQVNSIASSTSSLAFTLLPIPLKNILLQYGGEYMGCRLFSSSFSNMGKSSVPDELRKHLKGLRLILGEDLITNINASVTTLDNTTEIVFSSRVENKTVQDAFCSLLRDYNINVIRFERKVGSKEYAELSSPVHL